MPIRTPETARCARNSVASEGGVRGKEDGSVSKPRPVAVIASSAQITPHELPNMAVRTQALGLGGSADPGNMRTGRGPFIKHLTPLWSGMTCRDFPPGAA